MAGAVVEALKQEAKQVGTKTKEVLSKHIDKKEFGEFLAGSGLAAVSTVITGLAIHYTSAPFMSKQPAIGYLVGSLIAVTSAVVGYFLWKHYGDGPAAYFGIGLGMGAILYFISVILNILKLSLFV